MNTGLLRYAVATVLTVYGIETMKIDIWSEHFAHVATVLTVYGIETYMKLLVKQASFTGCNSAYRLRY